MLHLSAPRIADEYDTGSGYRGNFPFRIPPANNTIFTPIYFFFRVESDMFDTSAILNLLFHSKIMESKDFPFVRKRAVIVMISYSVDVTASHLRHLFWKSVCKFIFLFNIIIYILQKLCYSIIIVLNK